MVVGEEAPCQDRGEAEGELILASLGTAEFRAATEPAMPTVDITGTAYSTASCAVASARKHRVPHKADEASARSRSSVGNALSANGGRLVLA